MVLRVMSLEDGLCWQNRITERQNMSRRVLCTVLELFSVPVHDLFSATKKVAAASFQYFSCFCLLDQL